MVLLFYPISFFVNLTAIAQNKDASRLFSGKGLACAL